MQRQTVVIRNRYGLHTRPATVLVKTASEFKSDVFLTYRGVKVNAKSILGVLVLAVEPNAEVVLETQGSDEVEAMRKLVELVENLFGTEEQVAGT